MSKSEKFTKAMANHQKKWFGKWHTWAGVFAGAILIVVSLTGSILVFEEELDVYFHPELFAFKESGEEMSFQEVQDVVMREHPEYDIYAFFKLPNKNNATMLVLEDYEQVIVNPYTGEVTGSRLYHKTFLGIVRSLHRTLLIPTVGKYIVGFCTVFMVILMITGLRLWIPKRWSRVKDRLTIKRNASLKRQNYDLHNVLGFYFSPFITLISLTGIAITFSPLVILSLFLVSFEPPKSLEEILGGASSYQENVAPLSLDRVVEIANEIEPNYDVVGINMPRDSIGAFGVNLLAPGIPKTGDYSVLNLDQYSGEVLMNVNELPKLGKAYANWVTAIHYGTFGGMTTRIIALITTFIIPILFISGFIIWWQRWKKAKRAKGKPKKSKAIKHNKMMKPTKKELIQEPARI